MGDKKVTTKELVSNIRGEAIDVAELVNKPAQESPLSGAKIEAEVQEEESDIYQSDFVPAPGHYHLVKLDYGGKEIDGTDVSVSPKTFDRAFRPLCEGARPTYKVKKNPK